MRASIAVVAWLFACAKPAPPPSEPRPAPVVAAPAPAAPPVEVEPLATRHRDILDAIDRFLASPLDATSADTNRILVFVTESADIQVNIDENVVQWTSEKLPESTKALLLTAFFAADAGAQLRTGKKSDDLHAGIEGVLKVYRVLKTRRVVSPSLERLLDLEAKGELGGYLDQFASRHGP